MITYDSFTIISVPSACRSDARLWCCITTLISPTIALMSFWLSRDHMCNTTPTIALVPFWLSSDHIDCYHLLIPNHCSNAFLALKWPYAVLYFSFPPLGWEVRSHWEEGDGESGQVSEGEGRLERQEAQFPEPAAHPCQACSYCLRDQISCSGMYFLCL